MSAVSVGMNGVIAIEFPAKHESFAQADALTAETVEDFIDAQVEAGRIDIRVFI
ncbi:MAG: hypothetical protein ABIV04_00440 [Massilia sp.]